METLFNEADRYVTNGIDQKAFRLVRNSDGLQLDIKTRTRDKNIPNHIVIDAVSAVDQITTYMDRAERLKTYNLLLHKLNN